MKLNKLKLQGRLHPSAPQMHRPFPGWKAWEQMQICWARSSNSLGLSLRKYKTTNIKLLELLPRPWKGTIETRDLTLGFYCLHSKSTHHSNKNSSFHQPHAKKHEQEQAQKSPTHINFKTKLHTEQQYYHGTQPWRNYSPGSLCERTHGAQPDKNRRTARPGHAPRKPPPPLKLWGLTESVL